MSVLKYKSPVTGEWIKANTVKVVETSEGGESDTVVAEQLMASDYPDYITPEVVEMVGKVNAVRKDSRIVLLALSDPHYTANQTATTA